MNTSSEDTSKRHPIIVAAAVIRNGDRVLVAQRQGGFLAGKWEFPGGKLEPGESPEQCLARELKEELGIAVEVGDIFAVVYHVYEFGPILLLAYACAVLGECAALEEARVRWASLKDLFRLDLAPADLPIVEKIGRILAQAGSDA